jgi:indole-3-glycerol phosphate synthase
MTILEKIAEKKKDRLSSAKFNAPLAELKSLIGDMEKTRDFIEAIRRVQGPARFITEIKKASPSKGLIRKDFDHLAIAHVYEEKKVDAVSVITEEDFFQGRPEFLQEVRRIITRPVLRKDFLFDAYQIYETRAMGADALLLIAALLEKNQAEELLLLSKELGLSVLFEVHDPEELDTALEISAPVIGINNRNLKTLQIDLGTTFELKKGIPDDRIVVSESGIKTREDVLRLEDAGIDAILVGTSLMASADISAKIDELRGPAQDD